MIFPDQYHTMKCTYKQCYFTKVCVAFGNAFQIFQAVFFPLPANVETVSQPVTAYQNSRARQFSSFKTAAYVWIGRYLRFWPTPIPIHSSSRFNKKKWYNATTTTSLSTVMIDSFLIALSEAFFACRKMRVSASSWLHGKSSSKLFTLLYKHFPNLWQRYQNYFPYLLSFLLTS